MHWVISRCMPQTVKSKTQLKCVTSYLMGKHHQRSPTLLRWCVHANIPTTRTRRFCAHSGKELSRFLKRKNFCAQFTGPYRTSCIGESWPLYRELISQPETVLASCKQLPVRPVDFNRCVSGVIYVTMAQSNLSVDWAGDFCSQVPEEVTGLCFANSASRLIETDSRNVSKSHEVCRLAEAAGQGRRAMTNS